MNVSNIDAGYVLKFKALSEPTRLRMIPYLSEPHTVKQIADILGIDHHALYHHMRVLENASIVELVNTRTVGNIIEKYYQLKENWIILPNPEYKTDMKGLTPLIRQYVLSIFEDLSKSFQSGYEAGLVNRVYMKLSSDQLDNKRNQINELIKKFIHDLDNIEDKDGDLTYSVNMLHFRMPQNDAIAKQK